jgi:hypothetical protein
MMISITTSLAMVTVMLSRLWKVFSKTQAAAVGDHVERASIGQYNISTCKCTKPDNGTYLVDAYWRLDYQCRDEHEIESNCNRGNCSPYMKNPTFVKHIPITTTATK